MGTVGTYREKREARKAAERVLGVTGVESELEVRLLTESRRVEAEVRGDVLRALTLNALVPGSVDAHVDNGFVTLTGTAEWQYQRDEAEAAVENVRGVNRPVGRHRAHGAWPGRRRGRRCKSAFTRRARLDADGLTVATSSADWSSTTPRSLPLSAPGVREVDERIVVVDWTRPSSGGAPGRAAPGQG